MVVPDDAALLDLYEQFQTANGGSMEWTLFTTLSGTEEEKLEAYYNTFADYSGENYPDFSGTGGWLSFSTESKAMNLAEGYNLNGGFFFLGVFLGVLFLMAAVLIIYYKQISEGYEDRQRFQIMQKVGLERRQIKRSINRQILVVFFLPLLVAALHLLFDYRLIVLLLQLFAMNDLASPPPALWRPLASSRCSMCWSTASPPGRTIRLCRRLRHGSIGDRPLQIHRSYHTSSPVPYTGRDKEG